VQEGALVPGTLAADNFNYGGIKSAGLPGPSITLPTREFINGQWVTVQSEFRTFGDPGEGFQAIISFLQQNPRYQNALAIGRSNPEAFAGALGAAGYATDPTWADKIWNIGRQAVEQFGSEPGPALPPASVQPPPPGQPPSQAPPPANFGSTAGLPNIVELPETTIFNTPLGPFKLNPTGLVNIGGRVGFSVVALGLIMAGAVWVLWQATPDSAKTAAVKAVAA
jgi:hypothetical protein